MEIRYSREMNRNYMIIDAAEQGDSYECRMLAGNTIEGLLKFRIRQSEEKKEFYYEITSRQPLSRLLEKRRITGGEIRRILLDIAALLRRIEVFLLKEDSILLEADYVYVDPDTFSVNLCLVPGYSCPFPEAMSLLLKFLLERADHQDRDGVVLAYNLYQSSLKENYGMEDLLRHLSEENDAVFTTRKMDDFQWEGAEREQEKQEEDSIPGLEKWEQENFPGEKQPEKRERDAKKGRERWGDEPCERPAFAAGKQKKQAEQKKQREKSSLEILLRLGKCVTAAAAGGGIYWYVTGQRDILLCAAAAVLFLVTFCLTAKTKRGQENFKEEKAPGEGVEPIWEIQPESEEEHQARITEEKQEEIEQAREDGTELLAILEQAKAPAVLEPLGCDGEEISISYVPFVIGKNREISDYCLARPTVSRLHVRVDQKENVYILTDLNSTNGTSVNGYVLQANETVSIKNGDIIYLADVGFKFSEER